jgi:hypothetical protein
MLNTDVKLVQTNPSTNTSIPQPQLPNTSNQVLMLRWMTGNLGFMILTICHLQVLISIIIIVVKAGIQLYLRVVSWKTELTSKWWCRAIMEIVYLRKIYLLMKTSIYIKISMTQQVNTLPLYPMQLVQQLGTLETLKSNNLDPNN